MIQHWQKKLHPAPKYLIWRYFYKSLSATVWLLYVTYEHTYKFGTLLCSIFYTRKSRDQWDQILTKEEILETARLKFKTRLKHGWADAKLKPVFGGSATLFKFDLHDLYKVWFFLVLLGRFLPFSLCWY